jgi:pyruvate formate lyase activating enzyme
MIDRYPSWWGMAGKKGVVFDIKKFAIDDGPGIRTTVFLKGCPLRCWWCHNPEGQCLQSELIYRKNRCIYCDECIKNCPAEVLSFHNMKKLAINRKNCSLCGQCAQKCPTNALEIVGKRMDVKEVMREIDKDLAFYNESDGGITFSGGEPLLQISFLSALLDECQKKNVDTAVDTSGYAPRESVEKIKDKVGLFLYDIKVMDDKKHRKYTGVSNKQIVENFKRLAENGSNIFVRLPIVPGINDDEENVKRTGEFISSHGVKRTCLLPYHRGGIEKYRGLSRAYKLKATATPSDQKLTLIKKQLEGFGLDVKIGGG